MGRSRAYHRRCFFATTADPICIPEPVGTAQTKYANLASNQRALLSMPQTNIQIRSIGSSTISSAFQAISGTTVHQCRYLILKGVRKTGCRYNGDVHPRGLSLGINGRSAGETLERTELSMSARGKHHGFLALWTQHIFNQTRNGTPVVQCIS